MCHGSRCVVPRGAQTATPVMHNLQSLVDKVINEDANVNSSVGLLRPEFLNDLESGPFSPWDCPTAQSDLLRSENYD